MGDEGGLNGCGWYFVTPMVAVAENLSGGQVIVEESEDMDTAATAAVNASGVVMMDVSDGVPILIASMSSFLL